MHASPPPLLPDLFERVAALHADRVALEVPPGRGHGVRRRFTYAELADGVRALASELAAHIHGECVVAILLPRHSAALFVAQLGVLSAGGAFTCLEPSAPDAHLRFVLEDSGAVVLLSDAEGLARLGVGGPARRIDVRAWWEEFVVAAAADRAASVPPRPPPPRPAWLSPKSLAYVIYTSGSTGTPKGVLIEHGGIANLVASDVARFGLGPNDRAAELSSAAYDSSIEETWLAFAVGATLVVLDDDTARLGPDLATFLRDERITVFCPPPTLLRTMGLDDPRTALPDLRLLYVGGEALERDVADRWAPGRRLENGYGPTECTVTVLRTRVEAGEPVGIGHPVDGHRAWVLNDRLEEVPAGEPGELCIGGVGLARGYLSRPELTNERFPVHPTLGRIYRTGDLVRFDPATGHHYLGRIDQQVKLRGHRIELGAVESELASLPGVREAVCRLQASPTGPLLAAYVTAVDPARPPRWEEVAPRLRERLPEPMVPGRFAVLDALPKLASGKLDRKALPDVGAPPAAATSDGVAPRTEIERIVIEAFGAALGLPAAVSVEADFFLDLGGTSVGAAQVVSRLRRRPETSALTVRDLYVGRTAAALAARVPSGGPRVADGAPTGPARSGHPVLVTCAQALWILAGLAVGSLGLYAVAYALVPRLLERLGLTGAVLAAPYLAALLSLLYAPLAVTVAVVVKRVLIGRYRATRAPAWGGFHLRHWMVTRAAALIPFSLLQDTVLLGVVLRAFGARVGRGVHVHRGVDLASGGWDLLEIGDGASVGQEAALRLVTLDAGHVVVGPVTLGAGAMLETRAGVDAGGSVGAGAIVGPLAWVPPGVHVPAGERWDGVPARPTGPVEPVPVVPPGVRTLSPAAHGLLLLALRLVRPATAQALAFGVPACLLAKVSGVDEAWLLESLTDPSSHLRGIAGLVLLAMLSVPVGSFLSAMYTRLLGKVRPGVMPRYGFGYLRVLGKIDALTRTCNYLSGTLFWPVWLRLAGMKVGAGCEISTITDVVPECVTLGEKSFLADGIYLGGPRVRGGVVEVRETSLGAGAFIGNHVVIPAGCRLPEQVLLGVATVPDDREVRPGTAWFGHPAFEMPRQEEVVYDRRLTHEPTFLRRFTRFVWEAGRVVLPVPPLLALLAWLDVVERAREGLDPVARLAVAVPVATLGAALALLALGVATKWALLGRVRPGQRPLWSCWCSRWDFFYMAWDGWCARLLAVLEGTLLMSVVLRAVGTKVGRRALLGSGFAHVVDPDMLVLEDDVTVHAMFQAHSFEDRVLKMDRVVVERGATVGAAAVVFYGARIGAGTHVAPHSVVMKHEHLTPGLAYEGCPTTHRAVPAAIPA